MGPIEDTDTFLVNRNGESYQITKENLMAKVQDEDLMLVNRDCVSYKVSGKDVKDSLQSTELPDITGVNLEDLQVSPDRFTNEEFRTTITVANDDQSTKELVYTVQGNLLGDREIDVVILQDQHHGMMVLLRLSIILLIMSPLFGSITIAIGGSIQKQTEYFIGLTIDRLISFHLYR